MGVAVPAGSASPARADAGCGAACTNVSSNPSVLATELMQARGAGKLTEATITHGSIFDNEIGRIANGSIGNFPECNIDTRVLQTLVVTVRTYTKVQLTDLSRWCAHDGKNTCTNAHPSPWHCKRPAVAIDFGAINGNRLDGSNAQTYDLLRLLNSFEPPNMHVGQVQWRHASLPSQGLTNLNNEFSDSNDHLHVDFGLAGNGQLRVTNSEAAPVGVFDSASSPSAGALAVTGWAYDPDAPAASIQIEVWVDGTRLALVSANTPRPDVNAARGVPGNHGFSTTVTTTPGVHQVRINALDSTTGARQELGVRSVTVIGAAIASGRIYGATRYDGAADVSKAAFPTGAPVAYIVSAASPVDAGYTGAVAAKAGGPLLLTDAGALPGATQNELKRLNPQRVVFVGGVTAIPDARLTDAKGILPTATVSRVNGADRFETARNAIRSTFTAAPVVFVVDSNSWTDAIAAGNTAAFNGEPVMIVNGPTTTVDPADATLLRDLKTATIRVVGGPNSVSDALVSRFAAIVPNTARIYGADRFGTAEIVAKNTYGTASTAYLVSGLNYPDGLTASGFTGRGKSPLLLARPECVPQSTLQAIYAMRVTKVVLIGGPAVLGTDVAALKPCGL
ncbi:cell wall-binding repeat-containing protein [Leifsonia sp. 2TAF2]|uniref:cell wall-binding repeat-containing protein n=1 Tax=Leifsonia sp. 2TAF2 TaxID=3233009 RepID=UPI003F9B217E